MLDKQQGMMPFSFLYPCPFYGCLNEMHKREATFFLLTAVPPFLSSDWQDAGKVPTGRAAS